MKHFLSAVLYVAAGVPNLCPPAFPRGVAVRTRTTSAKKRKLQINADNLVQRIMNADTETLADTYEKKLKKIEREKLILEEKISKNSEPPRSYDSSLRTALVFLSNPHELWASGVFEDRKTLLKLTFVSPLEYVRNVGIRTAKTTPPFKYLADLGQSRNVVAEREGFEPSIGVTYTPLAGERLRPLGHLSVRPVLYRDLLSFIDSRCRYWRILQRRRPGYISSDSREIDGRSETAAPPPCVDCVCLRPWLAQSIRFRSL